MKSKITTIHRIREFNRFYTVLIGSLNRNYLGSEFTVAETRILFELISSDACVAIDLVNRLHIDKSYMSRIIKSFERKGLVEKKVSSDNKRFNIITLTEKGRKTVNELISVTNHQIADIIEPLTQAQCNEIVAAMDTITKYLRENEE